ncbi:branched-chain amino acid ABC transporter permease [uncultured Bartonella sp.]|uniref:branched-chain amino acid ABC transporter permease n=1 Tax=uncultured Bartonella sp. TaxID=104108 RepID=UPI002601A1A8|nr:branched-chain amino acid ABC transporter permease [uncultured Bartonella sp.]
MLRISVFIPVVCLILVVIIMPFFLNDYYLMTMISSLVIAGLALSWAMLSNLGGMTSFGHSAFFGIASYATTIFSIRYGIPIFLAIPFAGVIASLSAVLMLPIIRLSGSYFALAILAYAQIFNTIAVELPELTNGSAGIASIPPLPEIFGVDFSQRFGAFFLMLAIILVIVLIYSLILKSRSGLALKAISESEDACLVVGVNAVKLKFFILLLSAFIAGIIGAFNTHIVGSINPDDAFSSNWSLLPIIAAIFGGARTLWGPVIGAVVVYLFDQIVAKEFFAIVFNTSVGHQIILGIILALLILIAPNGLLSIFAKNRKAHA